MGWNEFAWFVAAGVVGSMAGVFLGAFACIVAAFVLEERDNREGREEP